MNVFRFLLVTKHGTSLIVDTYLTTGSDAQHAAKALPEMPEVPFKLYGQRLNGFTLTNLLLISPEMKLRKPVTAEFLCEQLKESATHTTPYSLISDSGDLSVLETGIDSIDKLKEPPNKEMIQIHSVTDLRLGDYKLDLSRYLDLFMRCGLMRAKQGSQPLWVDGRECDVIYSKVAEGGEPAHTDLIINLMGTEDSECETLANQLIEQLRDSPFGPFITDHQTLLGLDEKKVDAYVIRTSLDFQSIYNEQFMRNGK
ncbi:hypothetical protein RYA05_03335 [Pseudomonas syringae pv. actinidiae]|nr:hypothetical protein [Pseudomonas syringae pv. actinidiae]